MLEPSEHQSSATESEISDKGHTPTELLAAKAKECEAAIVSYTQAARLALEASRRALGMQTGVVKALLSGDPAGQAAEVAGQVYDGVEAIAEFAAALKAGGGTAAQYYKLSGAASQLALYALDLSELVKL